MEEKYPFGTLYIYDQYIIGIINEGENFDLENVETVLYRGLEIFKGKPWVYISHRINSYSSQPIAYKKAPARECNMVGYAAVLTSRSSLISTEIEKMFAAESFPFATFTTLDEAKAWVASILKTAPISD